MTKYKVGQTVYVVAKDREFDCVLTKQDILDIKKGEWEEVGFKITAILKDRPSLPLRVLKRMITFLKIGSLQ